MPRFHLPRRAKLWLPPAIVIPALLAWSVWGGDVASYLLFTHHLFWFGSIIVLVYPVSELVFPDSKKKPNPSAKAKLKKDARSAQLKSPSKTGSLTERLANLKRQKDTVDQELARLQRKRK